MKTLKTFLFVLCFWGATVGNASEALTTEAYADIAAKVEELSKKYQAENVLVVFDVDNTLLASTQTLGSDQWFSWQEEIIGSTDPQRVADSFPELLSAWGALLSFGEMRLTEPASKGRLGTAEYVKEMQGLGVKLIALTSRGFEYQPQTFRAFQTNQLNFEASAIGPKAGFPEIKRAYDPVSVAAKYGFTPEEIKAFSLDRIAQYATYVRGIFFTAGMNKGAMLRILLKRTGYQPKAIVFADDKQKHTDRVQQAFEDSEIEVVTYRYSREDENVHTLNESAETKQQLTEKWKAIQRIVRSP